jgi:hypothetical protein
MLGQEACEDAERYGVAEARRIETVAGSVFIRYSVASCAFVLVSSFESQFGFSPLL